MSKQIHWYFICKYKAGLEYFKNWQIVFKIVHTKWFFIKWMVDDLTTWNQLCAGKWLVTASLVQGQHPDCSVEWFLPCKYSWHRQFQNSNVTSVSSQNSWKINSYLKPVPVGSRTSLFLTQAQFDLQFIWVNTWATK